MASPHPTEGKCLYEDCGGPLTDIWSEFLESAAEKAALGLGKAGFTCPYCSRPLRFDPVSNRVVLGQGGELLRYHYGAAVRRAARKNSLRQWGRCRPTLFEAKHHRCFAMSRCRGVSSWRE